MVTSDRFALKCVRFTHIQHKSSPTMVKPHFIQNWMDPLHQDKKTRVLADKHAVQYQAYSSLGTQWISALGRNPVLMHPVLRKIGADVAASVPPRNISLGHAAGRGSHSGITFRKAHCRFVCYPRTATCRRAPDSHR